MGGLISGILGGIKEKFAGAPKQVRDALGKSPIKDTFPDYPWGDEIEERIKWLVERFYYEAQFEKIQLHRKWYRNHLIYCGYHDASPVADIGVTWNAYGQDSQEYAYASNYYRSYIRYGAAMYVQTTPEFVAQPTSPDPESQGVAEAARSVLELQKENIGYDAVRAMESINQRLYGNSFRYVYYSVDTRYGFVTQPVYEDVEVALDGGTWQCPNCGIQGEGHQDVCPQCGPSSPVPVQNTPPTTTTVPNQAGTVTYPKGQEVCEVIWPFEVYLRSSAKNLWEAPYLLRVRPVDTVSLKATFPKADWSKAQGTTETEGAGEDIGLTYQQAMPDLPNDPLQYASWYERTASLTKKILKQGWIRQSQYFFDKELKEKFPDGLYAAVSQDILLESRNESLDDHWTHFKHIDVPGRIWGDGDDDLITCQFLFDEVNRLILRHVDYNTLPLLLADAQRVDKNNIINDAGFMIEVKNTGGKPIDTAVKWLSGGQLSPDVWQWRTSQLQDMEFHSGVFGSAIGQHQPGVNSFGGQETMASRALQNLGPLQLIYKEANEVWAMQMLKLAAENWLDDRIQASMGVNGQWEFKNLRGEMLKTDRVRIQARIIPLDPAQQQAFAQAVAAQVLNPQDPVVKRKAMELYQLPIQLDGFSADAKVQWKEIEKMKQGQPVQPMLLRDNDQAHFKTLTDYMKSDEWDQIPPQNQALMYQHLQEHVMNMQKMAQVGGAIQAGGMEAGGAPSEQGGGANGQPKQNPNDNPSFRSQRGQKGAAAKPNRPQPPGGNGAHVGRQGQSHSAQQRRRNGK